MEGSSRLSSPFSFSRMPILFGLVARGTSVLAKHAECEGNFVEVCAVVLSKIPPGSSKLTYTHGNFLIHYISVDRIHYVCVTDDVRPCDFFLLWFYAASYCYALITGFRTVQSFCLPHRSETQVSETFALLGFEYDERGTELFDVFN